MPLLSMRSSSCLRWLIPALLVGTSALARGAPTSVGLLAVDGSAVEPGMGAILTDALRRNLPQLQGMRIEPRTHDLAEVKMVFGCGDDRADCMTKVGRNLEVNRLIYGSIRKQGANHVVQIRQLQLDDVIAHIEAAGGIRRPSNRLSIERNQRSGRVRVHDDATPQACRRS